MITTTAAELNALVADFMWPFLRIGGAFMAAPVFGTRLVAVRVRIALTLVLTLMLMPVLPPSAPVEPASLAGVLIAMQQVLIGLAMGFVLQLVFNTIVIAGETMATTMGLGFASIIDPQNGVNVPVVSQFLLMLGILVFLGLDGHLMLVRLLSDSFVWLPVGPLGLDPDALWAIAAWATRMFAGAVQLALPMVAALLVVYLALGVMTRAAPQLNIFSVGFPVTLLAGFILILLSLPTLVPGFVALLEEGYLLIGQVLGV